MTGTREIRSDGVVDGMYVGGFEGRGIHFGEREKARGKRERFPELSTGEPACRF